MHSTLLPVLPPLLSRFDMVWVSSLLLFLLLSRINSSNVSLPTPSLDLPDVAGLFAPPADNASRKRESNGSALHDSCSKFPRIQSQPRGIRSAAGNTLIPPQLRGRLVFFPPPFMSLWCHVGPPYYMYSHTHSANKSNASNELKH